jgi:hypothetical protein
VHGFGLEHEQLAAIGAMASRVNLETRCALLEDSNRPSGMRVRPVGVEDETSVQGLEAIKPWRAQISRVFLLSQLRRRCLPLFRAKLIPGRLPARADPRSQERDPAASGSVQLRLSTPS